MELFKKDLRQKKTRGTVDLPQDTEIATGSDPKHEGVWVGWYLPLMAVPEWDTKSKGCSVERLVRYPHAAQSSLVQKLGSEQTALKVICRMQSRQRDSRYYALAYPDPTTGNCKATFLERGILSPFTENFVTTN
ncbi:hypothetical protein ColTof4_07823 [Colletotrichum tofieldiae]|nr:hypothetical protein ColTof4_07823 [Colletotrichum tofieldiae]GKT83067.1 hypothetical protein Ct61P_00917 [Colletotrichum tofieldiae]